MCFRWIFSAVKVERGEEENLNRKLWMRMMMMMMVIVMVMPEWVR